MGSFGRYPKEIFLRYLLQSHYMRHFLLSFILALAPYAARDIGQSCIVSRLSPLRPRQFLPNLIATFNPARKQVLLET